MKVGLMIAPAGAPDLDSVVAQVTDAEAHEADSAWIPSVRSYDALTVLALAGQRTQRIELATFVIPTYPRHPVALAEQALTVQAASGGRHTLGIGLSHRRVMEGMLGLDWDHSLRHTREYLTCLRQLLSGAEATFEGQEYHLRGYQITVPNAPPPAILVAALGPKMLRLAGELADGTAVWMGGLRYLAEEAGPLIRQAAADAGRPAPRIVAGLPFCVTDQREVVLEKVARAFERYGQLPSYRAILDREGVAGPADIALVGNERELLASSQRLRDAGVTDLVASLFVPRGESLERTHSLLREIRAGA